MSIPPARAFYFDLPIKYMKQFIQYLKDTQAELKHVSWPTQQQTAIFTTLVILISIVIALYLGAFDFFFTSLLNQVI